VCSANSIRQEQIEKAVLDKINDVTKNTKVIEDVIKQLNEKPAYDIGPIEAEITTSKVV